MMSAQPEPEFVTGSMLRSAALPSARGLARGYDRRAVDQLLVDCAEGVDRLTDLLISAEDEIDRLLAERQRLRAGLSAGPAASSRGRRRLRQQPFGRARRQLRIS